MDNKIKVSVILPSLNVAAYIEECIESVINQSLQNIEIICVDAGSTDGTLNILKRYAQKDDRIKLIISDRKSYGYQVNVGVENAKGEYIGIVETDDYILKDMYKELYSVAKDNNADFVKADFYRFTKNNEELDKILFSLSKDSSYYNRIVNIEKEQECFNFPMNTWNGIYNRKFLIEHNILHNETPGASFQDNGFWFQTFIYAKRAYFLNKPYYMNRRDNPRSSVYDKDKMYCVCDEYEFIEDVLRKDGNIFHKFKYIFTCVCFQRYKGNLIRVPYEHQEEYLYRFSKKLQTFYEQEMLKKRMFCDSDWDMLISIINSPENYYCQKILPRQKAFDTIGRCRSVIIYGAGAIGKRTLNEIRCRTDIENVVCFAVSEKKEKSVSYQGIPIYDIHDLLNYRRTGLIVIAVSTAYQAEIKELLNSLGFVHTVTMIQ